MSLSDSQYASQYAAAGQLDWLLASFARQVPDVAHAITVSGDGLRLACSADLPIDHADQLAAVISGLASLTFGAARVMSAGHVRQTIVDMDGGVMLIMAVGDRALLGVLAAPGCDLGQIGYETAMLVHRVADALEPAARGADRGGDPGFGAYGVPPQQQQPAYEHQTQGYGPVYGGAQTYGSSPAYGGAPGSYGASPGYGQQYGSGGSGYPDHHGTRTNMVAQ